MGIKSFLFGGAPKYDTTTEDMTQNASLFGFGNMAGAQLQSVDQKGRPSFDYSDAFKPKNVSQATRGYDFSGLNQAQAGLNRPSLFKQTYNPAQFNFANLPNEIAQNQYALGSKDIRREGAGNLEKIRESIGVRRPGLISKASADSARDTGEQLGRLNLGLRTDAMNRAVDLGREQQLAQAGEDFRGYQSRADLEKLSADDSLKRMTGLADVGGKKVGLQSDIKQRDVDNQLKLQQLINDYYTNLMTVRRKGVVEGKKNSGLFGQVATAAAGSMGPG